MCPMSRSLRSQHSHVSQHTQYYDRCTVTYVYSVYSMQNHIDTATYGILSLWSATTYIHSIMNYKCIVTYVYIVYSVQNHIDTATMTMILLR